jgi:hypothetical protein
MKNWLVKHRQTIKKYGIIAVAFYAVKAIVYTAIIVWAAMKFSH